MREIAAVHSEISIAERKPSSVAQPESILAVCEQCQLKASCPIASASGTRPAISETVYDLGSRVFSEDGAFDKVYVIKSGSLQLSINSPTLKQKTIGFGFPGEIVGWESWSSGAYLYSATTLDKSRLCAIKTKTLLISMRRDTRFLQQLLRMTAQQVMREKTAPLAMLRGPVEGKTAAFILDIFTRSHKHWSIAPNVVLSMPRNAISSFLGISPESLSRCLSGLARKKAITVFNRRISVLDLDLLRSLATR